MAAVSVLSDIFGNFGSSNELKIGWDETDASAHSTRIGLPNGVGASANLGMIWIGSQADVIGTDLGIETGDSYGIAILQEGGAYAAGLAPIDGVATIFGVGTKVFQMLNPASGQVFAIDSSDSAVTEFIAESGKDLLLTASRIIRGGGLIPKTVDIDNTSSPYTVLAGTEFIRANTTSGAITVTLPAIASTNDKQVYTIMDSNYNAATNNITIARTGSDKIDNASASYVMSTNGTTVSLQANNATKNWQIY
jgi:hypothetical protein